MADDTKPAKKKRERKPRKMTETRLRNIAVYYCQRYLVSEEKLRNYLETRIYREMIDADERAAMSEHIPDIARRMAEAGLVNDQEAASSKLRAALRSGYAPRAAVNNATRSAQVDRETVEAQLATALTEALPELEAEEDDPAAMAALALKRARRGPWRSGDPDEKLKQRDANWLLRRGFRFDDVRKAMNIDPEEFA